MLLLLRVRQSNFVPKMTKHKGRIVTRMKIADPRNNPDKIPQNPTRMSRLSGKNTWRFAQQCRTDGKRWTCYWWRRCRCHRGSADPRWKAEYGGRKQKVLAWIIGILFASWSSFNYLLPFVDRWITILQGGAFSIRYSFSLPVLPRFQTSKLYRAFSQARKIFAAPLTQTKGWLFSI